LTHPHFLDTNTFLFQHVFVICSLLNHDLLIIIYIDAFLRRFAIEAATIEGVPTSGAGRKGEMSLFTLICKCNIFLVFIKCFWLCYIFERL